jgi:ABC-type nickel/cobalt efflux system permease component RcnA
MADPFRATGAAAPAMDAPWWIPEALRPAMGWLLLTQRQLIGDLQHHIALIRDGGSTTAAFAIVAVAMIYGAVHAAGPGHGKVVIASYFSSRRARLMHVLKMSGTMSLVQALSAIVLVSVISVILDLGSRKLMANAGWFETASFGLIGLFGIVIAGRAVRGRVGCGHDHTHSDHNDGHPHQHDHGPRYGHHHRHGDSSGGKGEILMGSLAVGLRPCTGALLILLFTFANGLYGIGITATLAMAAGSAVTIALVGLGAIGTRSLVTRIGGATVSSSWLGRAIAVAGGVVIGMVGFAMMAATWGLGPTG